MSTKTEAKEEEEMRLNWSASRRERVPIENAVNTRREARSFCPSLAFRFSR